MATNATFENLVTALRNKQTAPVYLLHGEEGYFIDRILDEAERLLTDDEKEFNQYTFYGAQTSADEVIDACRRFPMMADRQVVIYKEAQSARPEQLNKFARYIEQPSSQTVLFIVFRGADAKGPTMMAAMRKSKEAVMFQSKPVREYAMGPYITNFFNTAGLNVQPKALEMLKEFIGSDLSRMYNESQKLIDILGKGATVTPEAVEQHIGVSKDYNLYELTDAFANRDAAKVMRIAAYARANPKAMPVQVATTVVFGYFQNLLIMYSPIEKTERAMLDAMGFRDAYRLKPYNAGRRNYNASQVIEIIGAIRRFDAQSKGIGSRRPANDLLDELFFRILTAPGKLFAEY